MPELIVHEEIMTDLLDEPCLSNMTLSSNKNDGVWVLASRKQKDCIVQRNFLTEVAEGVSTHADQLASHFGSIADLKLLLFVR